MPSLPISSLVLRRRWIFLAFLAVLHLVFLQGPDTPLGRLLFLSHIGLGFIWQPFVQPRRRLEFNGAVAVVIFTACFAYFLNWELLTLWVMLLTGVVGGKVFLFPDRWERLFHLMALGYLVTAVLALLLPQSLAGAHLAEPLLADLVRYLMPAIFLLMATLPAAQGESERAEIVDYVYGVFVFLLLTVIVLGSLSLALLSKGGYFEALLTTLAVVAGILLLLGWIWNPRSSFGGLSHAVAQHIMSLGLPLEDWLQSLAELAKREEDPDRFLATACEELSQRLPGVVGGYWEGAKGQQRFGKQQGQSSRVFSYGRMKLCLVSRCEPGPSLLWHYDLAARLLAEFYLGKWRAQELQRLSYVEAIHDTGARLTHDVKNLLQSMETLCAAAQQESVTPSVRFTALMQRQLPEIATRLRQTLTKLSAPATTGESQSEPVAALSWLDSVKIRYADPRTEFLLVGDSMTLSLADATLFSSVAENLLQNLAEKRNAHPAVTAQVRLGETAGKAWLEVTDNGPAIAPDVATKIFSHPVPSENGLGIGLYQAARLALQYRYLLEVTENRDGHVQFRLAAIPQFG